MMQRIQECKDLFHEDMLLGGKISLLNESETPYFKYAMKLWNAQSLKEKGWEKIVGFQTRNVAHLGHEYLRRVHLLWWMGCSSIP